MQVQCSLKYQIGPSSNLQGLLRLFALASAIRNSTFRVLVANVERCLFMEANADTSFIEQMLPRITLQELALSWAAKLLYLIRLMRCRPAYFFEVC